MKKFLPLLLLLLAPVWAAPLAEAATKTVSSEGDLKTALLSLASEDITEIVINSDITLTGALPEVSPDADLTIKKGTAETIDGANKSIFKVMKGKVTFQGLTLTKGNGAVYAANGTDVKFDAVTFTGNSATGDGGAVKVDGGAKAEFTGGTKFQNNSAANGGAVHAANGADVKFDAVTFDGNKATGNGGAVYLETGGKAAFANDLLFENNTATGGGALYVFKGTDATFSAKSTFRLNSAKDGGAIYVNSDVLTLPEGIVLTANDATENGGAVALGPTATVRFANKEITRNHAKNGGAVHAPAGSKLEFTSDFSFANNSADEGGAVYAQALTLNPESHKLTFDNNRSRGKGGAVYVSDSVTVNGNVTFQNNGADGSGGMGGAVYSAKDVTTQKAAFKKNSAGGSGGAVYVEGAVKGTGSTFQANQAALDGGAIYATGATALDECSFLENKTTRGPGGAIRTDNAGTDVRSCTFKDNISGTNGGAVFLDGGSGASSFRKVYFDKNIAPAGGGAISCGGTGTNTIEVSDSAFLNNTAGGSQGGALNLAGAQATVVRSTFEANECATGNGGAIFSAAALSRIANCTFFDNQAGSSGEGGAVTLDGTDNERTALFYNTFVGNKAGGNGGGLYTRVAVRMMGNVLVGNNAPATHGADVFSAGSRKITSLGYNVMRVFGTQGGSGPIDVSGLWTDYVGPASESVNEDSIDAPNTPAAFFGADPKLTESNVKVGAASHPLKVLVPSNPPNKLLDRIPNRYASSRFVIYFSGIPNADGGKTHTDERGQDRDTSSVGDNDIGAYERGTGGSPGDPDNPGVVGGLASIRISGVPNSLTSIGQTASLVAEAYDQGGKRIAAPVPVTWSSSNTGVAHIDDNGNLVALSLGTTVIRATTKSNAMSGSPATDSVTLTVDKDVSDYLNIHPRIWQQLGIYNEAAASSGSTLAFADVDPALVKAGAFQTAFRGAWSTSASQITKLGSSAPIAVKSASGFSIDGYTVGKPGASLTLGGRKKGEVLALLYRWSFSWETLSKLLGRKVTEAPSVSELFKALRVDFVPAAGATGWNVIGAGGVSAQDAAAKGALKLVRGNNGVTVALTAYLANVGGAAPSGARLMNGLLVVPDGTADASVGGTMWISQKAAPSGGGSKGNGEGGGGCSLGLVGALGLALAGGVLLRRR